MRTAHKIFKQGWTVYENTCIKNRLPFDIRVTIEINENRQLEIVVEADEPLRGKLEVEE